MSENQAGHARRLAIVSTYPPRRCGIGAYTWDLRTGLRRVAPDLEIDVVAIDRDGLSYPMEVVAVADQHSRADYLAAVATLADRGVDAVLVQHEFGREYGSPQNAHLHEANLAAMCEALVQRRIPYVVALHTVLSDPPPLHRRLLHGLCTHSAALVVFTQAAKQILIEEGIADAGRLVVIPHGAPEILWSTADPSPLRAEIADLGTLSTILTTFGLLSPAKGLEDAITAVARLKEDHPDVRYVIAGQTHPEELRHHGERYRNQLTTQVAALGLDERVRFLDFFLDVGEIAALLRRTAIFLTPYKSPKQASSGALTFALAAGVPIVSTDYVFARETLASGGGLLTPCGDTAALTNALADLLTDPGLLQSCASQARRHAQHLPWTTVAQQFNKVIRTALA